MKGSAISSTATRPQASPANFTARPNRYALTGRSAHPDPRVHAYRGDLADIDLADRLFAPHYARAESCALIAASAMVHASPSSAAPAVTQLMRGEGFELLDRAGGWAWGRCAHDDYVGYLPDAVLSPVATPDHRVTVPSALLFADPDIKSRVLGSWPIGARFAAVETGAFLDTGEGFIHKRHAASLDSVESDPVTIAERMVGSPYLWGGRGGGGIDCSGLIQLALSFAGIDAPRDSDQQRETLGRALADDDTLRRGDLLFFPGHVAMMLDATRIIHANAFWMTVAVEPLADLVARLAPDHARPILARRRIE